MEQLRVVEQAARAHVEAETPVCVECGKPARWGDGEAICDEHVATSRDAALIEESPTLAALRTALAGGDGVSARRARRRRRAEA